MNISSIGSKDSVDFDPVIPEDERRFYLKAYQNVNHVRDRKVHCTVCKMHIGTAPSNESIIRMHPILRVTHCKKCHEFYNSGEFSKGEDGSELYCRWCGQGGEVYCCSNCPYVFCKSCIISNLSRGVVADIEQNENWSCFNCAPKMLWPLRAQHWALIKFIDKQKKAILNSNLSDAEIKTQMTKDRSSCCKIKKPSGYGTDSSDSSDISLSRLKQKAGDKRSRKSISKEDISIGSSPAQAKKIKSNDEVVCTPDVMSMLEPECTLTVPANANAKQSPQPATSTPKILSIPQTAKRISTPPLLIRNNQSPNIRPIAPGPVLKKTVVGPRLPTGQSSDFSTPVYHTINGYRIDLNSAAQQETVRLPNGKLIQVKRQGTGPQTVTTLQTAPTQHSTPTRIIHNATAPPLSPITNLPTPQIVHSSGGHIIRTQLQTPRSVAIQNQAIIPQYQQPPQQIAQQQYQQITIRQPNQQIATIRYQGNPTQQMTNMIQNGTMQLVNGNQVTTPGPQQLANIRPIPTFVKQFFPNTALGQSRTQLQNQIFNAMEICQHLMGKVQTLTNSNAYKTAKSMTDVKELYIHLSYLLTYAIGRFKGLQDSCLSDMRDLGFTNDANSLENGQLAAEKQASDAEEDEITIVEPKTDTINLDSDNEDDIPPVAQIKPNGKAPLQSVIQNNVSIELPVPQIVNQIPIVTPTTTTNADDELTAEYDFSKVASLLAGMLEVELTEGSPESVQIPKKPRKKTTNKPNPTLLKQKEIQERERLENIKKNCAKLKMQVQIPLNKVEDIYEYAKPLVEKLKLEAIKVKKAEEEQEEEHKPAKEENILPLDEKEKKEEIINDEKINSFDANEEAKSDEKDDSEEVVVVVVEDLDNSKEENEEGHINGESNEETVEISDHDELQGDQVQQKDLNDLTADQYKSTEEENVKIANDDKNLNKLHGDDTDDEVAVCIAEENEEEVKEPEVLSNTENKSNSEVAEEEKILEVETDKNDEFETTEDETSLLVPIEDAENTDDKNVESSNLGKIIDNKDVEQSLESGSLSHNMIKTIVERAEVV